MSKPLNIREWMREPSELRGEVENKLNMSNAKTYMENKVKVRYL